MKHLFYISAFILLLWACAGSGNQVLKESPAYQDTAVVQRYEPRITPVPAKQNKQKENKETEETQISTDDFNEITRQKTKQFLDMLAALNNKENPENLQAYIDKYARKLWANPDKSKVIFQDNRLKTADSFQIQHFQLINFEEENQQESIGNYKLKIKAYKNGKNRIIPARLKMYFLVDDLNVDGKIYKTITAKIIQMKLQ